MNKKNFFINKIEYTIVIGCNNYLQYHVQHKKSTHYERKRIYKGFQKVNDIDELYKLALKRIAVLQNMPLEILEPGSKLHEYILNHKYRYRKRTYEQFEGACNRFVAWCSSHRITPHKITYLQARNYISDISAGKKSSTVWNIQLVLKTIFNGLKKEKLITENVFADLPKIKKSTTSLMYFNSVQIKAIKEYCMLNDRQLYQALLLVFACAIRSDELRSIQLFDIIFEDNIIELRGDAAKGIKTHRVFMSDQVKKELTVLQHFPAHYYLFGKNGVPAEKMVSYNFLNDKHRLVLKELKYTGRYALYSWRHTGAVMMVRAGINIKLIQQHFRHSSLDMTDEYLKNLGILDNDDLKNKMPKL